MKSLGETVGLTKEKEINEVVSEDLEKVNNDLAGVETETEVEEKLVDDRGIDEAKKDEDTSDDDLYNIKNFSI